MPRVIDGTTIIQPANTSRVYFNIPIHLEFTPNSHGDIEQLKNYTWEEMAEFAKICEMDGFSERAVVALKPDVWRARECLNWGIVTSLSRYKPHGEVYRPIVVKWVKDGKETRHWPEELWLIHSGISHAGMNTIIEAQK